jgi:single-stranded-DNA-specific exonuclease
MGGSGDVFALGISHSALGRPWRWRHGDDRIAQAIAQTHGVPDVVAKLLTARHVGLEDAPDVLSPTLRRWMPDPSLLKDMDIGAQRLSAAIDAGEPIAIFGDYDVDGATSAALLVRCLRHFGTSPGIYVPDRITEGYGPNVKAMQSLAEGGARLVICVDCGTQGFEALAAARDAGLDVIVVDHHKASTALPVAQAIINPNRFDESAESAALGHMAAVGVAFLLCVALNRLRRLAGKSEAPLLDMLDVVALGTVCDVVPLTGLNRAFVSQGLKVMARREQMGLRTLMDVAGLGKAPDAGSLGFHLGPRINAGGRVGRSDLGVRLLTTQDEDEARSLARQLDDLNAERKTIEALVQEQAESLAVQQDDPVLLVAGHGWHPGVIGIVAGRLKEKFGRPALVVALESGTGKGSGRSISGVDLGAAIIAAKDEGLLIAGGGHAMAAGLTIAEAALPAFRSFLNGQLGPSIAAAREGSALMLDASLAPAGLTGALARAVEGAGPFGAGWPAPRVALGPVTIVKANIVGADHVRVIASGSDGGRVKAVAFRHAATPLGDLLLDARGRKLWLAGRLQHDDWNGRDEAELHLEDAAILP